TPAPTPTPTPTHGATTTTPISRTTDRHSLGSHHTHIAAPALIHAKALPATGTGA
ncbi:adhesin, partial [Cutibacterium acnes]|nr:adhesin [Cutibacterium acnes]